MARVTVEDCIDKVPNRFELVLISSLRARQLSSGNPATVERDNDKNPVVALREIADETLTYTYLKEAVIESYQKHIEVDEPEEEEMTRLVGGDTSGTPEDDMSEENLLRALMESQQNK